MSIKIMSWVFENPEPLGAERLVMLSLADNANDDGYCWPSLATIARKAGIERRSVIRVIDHLIETGYLVKRSRSTPDGRQTSNVYRILWTDEARREEKGSDVRSLPGDVGTPYSDVESLGGSDVESPPQCPTVTPPVTQSHSPSDVESPESSLNHQLNHQLTGGLLLSKIIKLLAMNGSLNPQLERAAINIPAKWDGEVLKLSPGPEQMVLAARIKPIAQRVLPGILSGMGVQVNAPIVSVADG